MFLFPAKIVQHPCLAHYLIPQRGENIALLFFIIDSRSMTLTVILWGLPEYGPQDFTTGLANTLPSSHIFCSDSHSTYQHLLRFWQYGKITRQRCEEMSREYETLHRRYLKCQIL